MDFFRIKERSTKNGVIEIYPDFRVLRSKDLMIRGKSFYAIWDEDRCLWSTDEYDVQRLVDAELLQYKDEVLKRNEGVVQVKLLGDFSSNSWLQFRNYVGHLSDSSYQLDESLTFSNTEVTKADHVSRKLPYPLAPGDVSAWNEIVGTLYTPEERAKIEWTLGAIVAGESKFIQKFLVFYGGPGTGKSTILNIFGWMFEGYSVTFDAKSLGQATSQFATEAFRSNPLVAIQHDGDLSKIDDNARLNSIISHEMMQMNEKFKPSYDARVNAMLLMGTNKPVKISDAKSGIIRRLIDVQPSGNRLPPKKYDTLMAQVKFEYGAIAHHCLEVFKSMGRDYYSGYVPVEMMLQTDVFFNYIEAYYDIFKEQDGVTLNQGYEMYKQFCDEALVEYKMPRYKFREELKNYFKTFEDRAIVDEARVRSWYSGFVADKFKTQTDKDDRVFSLVMDDKESLLDNLLADFPAQYSSPSGTPRRKWTVTEEDIKKGYKAVETVLSDLDTKKEHYVKVPPNLIVIDFDLEDANGEKSRERNLEAASQWPATYAEFSKSGNGVHLHYFYEGDVDQLSRLYANGIEVKVYTGDSSLRRKVSWCNNVPVATINSGLPLKEKKVINSDVVKSERSLRDLIERNLRKEIHPGTKPSMDFIYTILEEAYESDLPYDVTNMRQKILNFGANSSHHNLYCIKLVQNMKFKSEDTVEPTPDKPKDERLVFFDTEVFKNLFVVCWKYEGETEVVTMINPSSQAIEEILSLKLVGFNCRRYDNHILYGALMGYTPEQLYNLSQKLISGSPHAYFGEAYNLSYTDIFDFSSKKQSLKKFQIELGLNHRELGLPWEEPVAEDMWEKVAEYCRNDVITTEQVFNARKEDFIAREILADLSGLSLNATTQ